MQKIFLTCVLLISALSIQATDIAPISEAFKTGNANLLKEKMATEVDIVVPGASKKGTAKEAIAILDAFFKANKPTGYTVAHHADKNECGFLVGKLATANKEFRVNITYAIKEGKILLSVIRIE